MKPFPRPKEKYQNCIITLDDGTTHTFTGKAFAYREDRPVRMIKDIAFTEPKELPAGYTFEGEPL